MQLDLLPQTLEFSIAGWINQHMNLTPDSKRRLATLFWRARFNPAEHIDVVELVDLEAKGMWQRLLFRDSVAQRPSRVVMQSEMPDKWITKLYGLHATDTVGATAILSSLRLCRMTMPGVYCGATVDAKHFDNIRTTVGMRVCAGKKDLCHVVMELYAEGFVDARDGGTVEVEDTASVAAGRISHNRRDKGYCVPEDLIRFKGFWVKEGLLWDIEHVGANEL